MGHTYSCLFTHMIFSTRGRQRFLTRPALERLAPYVGGVVRKLRTKLVRLDGTEDHVHLLLWRPPSASESDLAREIKSSSSKWLKTEMGLGRLFAWQEGFSVFSVSNRLVPKVVEYIQAQEQHHRRETFEDEIIRLLEHHGIDYDPAWVFD